MKHVRNTLAVIFGFLIFYATCYLLLILLRLTMYIPIIYKLLTIYIPHDYLIGTFPILGTSFALFVISKVSASTSKKITSFVCFSIIILNGIAGMILKFISDGFSLPIFYNYIMYIVCPIAGIYFGTKSNDENKEDSILNEENDYNG